MIEDKVMLITGTRTGIGRYLAEYYLKKGFKVIGCSRENCDLNSENYLHFCLDVCDEKKVKEMFSEILKKYDCLDIVINNAGVHAVSYAVLTSLEMVKNVFESNLMGTFLVCREAAKLMKKNTSGKIINFSSIVVPLQSEGASIYGASKAAIEYFSKVFAKEVFQCGIRVNVLGLSLVRDSGMIKNLSEEAVSNALNRTIWKTKLEMEDVASAIDLLISEKNKKITGQVFYLGGV